jgi:hypothetical protein
MALGLTQPLTDEPCRTAGWSSRIYENLLEAASIPVFLSLFGRLSDAEMIGFVGVVVATWSRPDSDRGFLGVVS